MNADNPLAYNEPVIEADLGTNGGKVSFFSIWEALVWVEEEIRRWEFCLSRSSHYDNLELVTELDIMEKQLRLPKNIRDILNRSRPTSRKELPVDFLEISALFGQYADYESLNSQSRIGAVIFEMLSKSEPAHALAMGGLFGILQVKLEDIIQAMRMSKFPIQYIGNELIMGYVTWGSLNLMGNPKGVNLAWR